MKTGSLAKGPLKSSADPFGCIHPHPGRKKNTGRRSVQVIWQRAIFLLHEVTRAVHHQFPPAVRAGTVLGPPVLWPARSVEVVVARGNEHTFSLLYVLLAETTFVGLRRGDWL